MTEEEHSGVFADRRRKLQELRDAGIDPFPHEFGGVEPIAEIRERFGSLTAGEETDSHHRIAGRIAARRGQGRMAFLDLVDRSGRIQLQARVDELGEEGMQRLLELDLGDLVGIEGLVFSSRRGELTLRIERYALDPGDVDLPTAAPDALAGGTPEHNAEVTRRIFAGEPGPPRDLAALNAGAAIYVAGGADTIAAGVRAAEAKLDDGAAAATLERFVAQTRELAPA